MVALFGSVQMLPFPAAEPSRSPDELAWFEFSVGYSFIVFGLSVAQGNFHGTFSGQTLTPSQKAFGILNAIG